MTRGSPVRSSASDALPLVSSAPAPRGGVAAPSLPRIHRPWRRRVQPEEAPPLQTPPPAPEAASELRAWRTSPTRTPPRPLRGQ